MTRFRVLLTVVILFQQFLAATSKTCRITKVTPSPCLEALRNEPCHVHKGDHVVTNFSFVPSECIFTIFLLSSYFLFFHDYVT